MALGVFRAYEPLRAQYEHIQPKPGDRLPLKGLDVDVVSVSRVLVQAALPGDGQVNDTCVSVENHPEDGTENFRSVGMRLQMGRFRFVDLGDLSGNTLAKLACPIDLLESVSVYLVVHNGNYDTNIHALVKALDPQAAIMNNGAVKGGDPSTFATLHAQPTMDLWQLHESRNEGTRNSADAVIANVDEGLTAYWIKLTARRDGSFEILNSRTAFVKRYRPMRLR